MTGLLVLFAFSICTLWLFWRDVKERASVSSAVWIVLAWAVIYGSRPVTSWFSEADPGSYDEGNPVEALVYLCLIVAGVMVLRRRNIRWPAVVKDNGWLFLFYLFWLMSVLWSDYPVITLKRLVKDLGNVVMVLVLLTGREPGEAVRAVFVRFAYVCIPLSIVLMRYFPELGRAFAGYDRSAQMYVGVTTHKNTLGALALVAALFVLWDLLELRGKWRGRRMAEKITRVARGLVLLMCWYLLLLVDSATSLVCAVFGSLLLVGVRVPSVRRYPGRMEACGCGAALVLWLLDSEFNVKEAFVQSLGRDTTLTTRIDVWPILIAHQDNPLGGAGFNTFWAGRRLVELGERVGGIIQAHNGYLETYLNGGWVGIGLLVILLVAAYRRIRRQFGIGSPEGSIRFVFVLLAIIYNVSEASFNKLSVLWFVTVFAIMEYRARPGSRPAVPDKGQSRSVVGAHRP